MIESDSVAHDEPKPTTVLVEIQPGLAVLYGDHVPDGLEVTPFSLLDRRAQASLNAAIAGPVGSATSPPRASTAS